MKMEALTVRISSISFQEKSAPKLLRIKLLVAAKGRAASRVPAGQINLQKAGTPTSSLK